MTRRPEVPRAAATAPNVVAVVVLALAALALLLLVANWSSWTSRLRSEVATIPSLQSAEQGAAGGGSESLLLLVTDGDDQVGAIALVAVADDPPATLTVVPTGLFELLPGYGEFPLADAVAFEGPELARIAVANALGVRIDRVVALGPGRLGIAFPDPVRLDLPEPVLTAQGGGLVQLADAGIASYGGGLLERLLVEPGESSQISWLERQAAVWRGLLDAMAAGGGTVSGLVGEGQAADTLVRAVASARVVVELIPMMPVAVAGAEDGFQLVQADVAAFVADRLSDLATAEGERARVEVLNGNGEILATRSVVEAVVAAGFHVVKTDNADSFDFEETIVIAQGRSNLDAAEAAAALLGVGRVQLEVAAPSGVVDLSIIVGRDIATLRS